MSSLLSLSSEEEQREREREYVRFVVSNEKKTKRVFPSLSLCVFFSSPLVDPLVCRESAVLLEKKKRRREMRFFLSLFQVDTLEVVRYSI